jgi:hypothetical protein
MGVTERGEEGEPARDKLAVLSLSLLDSRDRLCQWCPEV